MKWDETFTPNQIKPCENDGDLEICVKYCYLCQDRYASYNFSWAFILDDDCINAKFCM